MADTINGLGGNDRLTGAGGNDILNGGDGNDTLFGGDGTDLLNGGAGIDTALYTVNTTALLVDLALGRVSFPGQTWSPETLVSIENIETGSGSDSITGSAVANLITTNGGADYLFGAAGNDTLLGGDGNDTLYGGDGTDLLNGGAGADTALYAINTTSLTVDLVLGRVTFPGQTWTPETLISIENIQTGSGNDSVTGGATDNLITTNAGADLVSAGDGNDTLIGGTGNDTLNGGIGNDTFDGGDGTDRFDGGEGNDTALYAVNTTALSADLTAGTVTFIGQSWSPEHFTSIESVQTGSGNDTVLGTDEANTVTANAGNDLLVGGDGNDNLVGGSGNDTLCGGEYSSHVVYLQIDEFGQVEGGKSQPYLDGADILNGGDGVDTLRYQSYTATDGWWDNFIIEPGIIADLKNGYVRFAGSSIPQDTISFIENIITGRGDDIVYGGDGANRIEVNGGANAVYAGDGNDTIVGGFGEQLTTLDFSEYAGSIPSESLNGNDGNDLIYGNGSYIDYTEWHNIGTRFGEDSLSGGSGNDTIVGGMLNSVMSGGSGADSFVFDTGVYANDFSYDGPETVWALEGQSATVTDFSRVSGDRIIIDVNQNLYSPNNVSPRFVGEATSGDFFELTYRHITENGVTSTVAEMKIASFDDEYNSLEAFLTIKFQGYSGTLQASDFIFT